MAHDNNMLSRRTFLNSPAALAAPAIIPSDDGNRTPRFWGTWGVNAHELVKAGRGRNRYHLVDETHDGPAIQFPRGVPSFGDKVMVCMTADLCLNRGEYQHRPRARWVVRVYPYTSAKGLYPDQGAIYFTREQPTRPDAFRLGPTWWITQDRGESVGKYDPPTENTDVPTSWKLEA